MAIVGVVLLRAQGFSTHKAGTSGASTRRASALELIKGLLLLPGDRSLVAAAFPNLERDWR